MSKSELNTKIFNRAQAASTVLTAMHVGDKLSLSAVNAAIKGIRTSGEKLDNQIHGTAVACIIASLPTDKGGYLNGEPARQLLNAMPRGSRAKALAAWFEAFSNIRLTLDKGKGEWTVKLVGPAHPKLYKDDVNPDKAMERPFWSVEERPTDAKAFTLGSALAALLRKAEAAAKEGKLSPEDAEIVQALRNAGKPALAKVEAK